MVLLLCKYSSFNYNASLQKSIMQGRNVKNIAETWSLLQFMLKQNVKYGSQILGRQLYVVLKSVALMRVYYKKVSP